MGLCVKSHRPNAEGVLLPSAQGCARQRATLGMEPNCVRNPEGVADSFVQTRLVLRTPSEFAIHLRTRPQVDARSAATLGNERT